MKNNAVNISYRPQPGRQILQPSCRQYCRDKVTYGHCCKMGQITACKIFCKKMQRTIVAQETKSDIL